MSVPCQNVEGLVQPKRLEQTHTEDKSNHSENLNLNKQQNKQFAIFQHNSEKSNLFFRKRKAAPHIRHHIMFKTYSFY